jgi:hypothetical protein
MIGRSSEQVSFGIIKGLPPGDRRLVREWVDRTGCDWTTALLNSGVMSSRTRHTPEEGIRDQLQREHDQAMETWLNLMTPPDDVQNRREAAEHEAAHAVTAQAFGSDVSVAAIAADHSGMCRFTATGLTDLQRAAVMLAPKVWINTFRSLQFPRGATGMEQDVRDAAATGADLEEALRLASAIVRENHDAIVSLADKIDAAGHWFGPTAS